MLAKDKHRTSPRRLDSSPEICPIGWRRNTGRQRLTRKFPGIYWKQRKDAAPDAGAFKAAILVFSAWARSLKAMAEARRDPEFFIVARTDTADRLTPFAQYNQFVGLPEAMAREARFTRV
jgi:hypothetical protein